ncbi:MAG: LysM peptidoglycan-binding domain-containing protein [Deltaproteobacteria bacterium]|jgi:LysM repeat protein|nr:LysM peptidoglycan-binding domain-containing protein [Deltaproteobacteria bacterium]
MFKTSPADWLSNWSARGIISISLALSLALVAACGGVSEEDLQNLKAENLALEAELEQEKHQSDVLNRALTNAYRERDRLVDLLNAQPQVPEPDSAEVAAATEAAATEAATEAATAQAAAAAPAAGGAGAQPGQTPAASGDVYVVQTGDTLSTIAQRHNTSTEILLALNPYLTNRNNFMVWENDKIRLPR